MELRIDGQTQKFTDLKTFRQHYQLPDDFGIGYFEKKDYAGLGKIDAAGASLKELRAAVLDRLPAQSANWLETVAEIESYFRQKLEAINPEIGLRSPEIDFAVAGFADVLRAVVYAKIRPQPPSFQQVYYDWLSDSLRVSALIHEYHHENERWTVQVINFAYGRIGLFIGAGFAQYYVLDGRLACPAQGFMGDLLRELGNRILNAP